MKNFLKNLQQGISIGIGIVLILSLSGAVYAWIGITAEDGDSLTYTKWNEMVGYTVPTGAVMAFNLAACPTGWSEYTPAYGRVIRGIDKSGSSIDPDGQRALGNLQEDEIEAHTHGVWLGVPNSAGWAAGFHGFAVGASFHNGDPEAIKETSESTGGTETRSKNVALLYCEKN